jgi:hypothetical protein
MNDVLRKTLVASVPLVIGAVAGYFGYEPIQEKINPPVVDVDVHIPEDDTHSHPSRDWSQDIIKAVNDANRKHLSEYH